MLKSTNQLHIGCIVCSLNWSLAIEYERKQEENRILDELLLPLLLILVTVSDRKKYGKKKKKGGLFWHCYQKSLTSSGEEQDWKWFCLLNNEWNHWFCVFNSPQNEKNWLSLCGWIHDSVNFFTSGCVSLDNKTVTRWMKGHKKF